MFLSPTPLLGFVSWYAAQPSYSAPIEDSIQPQPGAAHGQIQRRKASEKTIRLVDLSCSLPKLPYPSFMDFQHYDPQSQSYYTVDSQSRASRSIRPPSETPAESEFSIVFNSSDSQTGGRKVQKRNVRPCGNCSASQVKVCVRIT